MELDDIFDDGPFAGEMLEDVIEDHRWYIEQLVQENFVFSDEAYELMSRKGIT